MNKEQINEFLESIELQDEEKFLKILEIKKEEWDTYTYKQQEDIWKKIMNEIELGEYEYFRDKIKENNPTYKNIIPYLISFSSKDEYKIELIEKREEYGVSEEVIPDLIKSLNDLNFIKECVRNGKEYGLNSYNIAELIEAIHDPEFTKECIRNGKECGLDSCNTARFIREINDIEFTKECVRKGKEYGLDSNEISELIEVIHDPEFTEECIRNGKECGLDSYNIAWFIRTINDIEFTKECVRNGKEYGLNSYNIAELIEAIHDPNFNLECKENIERYGLDGHAIITIVEAMNDIEFTKECVRKGEKYALESYSIARLIESIHDPEFTKECIRKGKEYGLDSSDIVKFIKRKNVPDFTIECIRNREKYGIKKSNIADLVKSIYVTLSDEEKLEGFESISKFLRDEQCDLPREDMIPEEYLLENSDVSFISKYWGKLGEKDKKKYVSTIINELINKKEGIEVASRILNEINDGINNDNLMELLKIDDAEYLKEYIIKNIIRDNINKENINVLSINEEIDKLHQLFLTNTLPECFKIIEFFRNHKNHDSNNREFYKDINVEKRDNIIAGDLFRILLESNNIKMRTFLETLYNGNLIMQGNIGELDEAILLKYRDVLYDLLDVTESNTINKTEDYKQDLNAIREYLSLQENDDVGEKILLKYFEKVDLKYKKDEKSLVETLLKFMDIKKEEAQKNNHQAFNLEEGDLIKGTEIKFLESVLKNGIRAKEFLMVGSVNSDATPLDTDFSEISKKNLEKGSLKEIINSTFSSEFYGKTYFMIKKDNYENDEISYTSGSKNEKTRYFRTGIGSTYISAIVTSEWNDEYKYVLGKNGFYIPVINKEDGKILFSYKEYEEIREKMQGLTHYGINDFEIEPSAYSMNIEEKADKLRKDAESKISTAEKREKVIDLIRKNIGKNVTTEMLGDISGKVLEFIDTGSTR